MSVQSLDRALDILELLANRPNGLGVTDVAAAIGLHKSTAGRLLIALRERGYLEKDPATSTYRIGLKCVDLAGSQLDHLELKVEAKPAMYELSATTGQTAFLAILKDDHMVYVEKTEAYNSLRRYSIIGTQAPLHSTALGKAALMALPQGELQQVVRKLCFSERTPQTHRNADSLLEDLAGCRLRGYSVDDRENEPEVRCVAAPIIDYRGRPIAAVSVSGRAGRFDELCIAETGAAVTAAAGTISHRIGWRTSTGTAVRTEGNHTEGNHEEGTK